MKWKREWNGQREEGMARRRRGWSMRFEKNKTREEERRQDRWNGRRKGI